MIDTQERVDWSERAGRWLLTHSGAWVVIIVSHFLILSFVALGVLLIQRNSTDEIRQLRLTAQDTNKVANFLEECLLQRAKLTPAEQAQRCGAETTGRVVLGLFNGITCVLQLEVPDRTQAAINACAQRGIGTAK